MIPHDRFWHIPSVADLSPAFLPQEGGKRPGIPVSHNAGSEMEDIGPAARSIQDRDGFLKEDPK